jgi:hypothetical protein
MHDQEKSDSGMVAGKPTNKAGRPAAESVEPRPEIKGNADQQKRTPDIGQGTGEGAGPRTTSRKAKEEGEVHRASAPRREATGDMIVARYADDLVAGFEHEEDARRFLDAMRTRFETFALALHPEKTRLIEFGRQAAVNREKRGLGKPETYNFLGFTARLGSRGEDL